MFVGNVCECAVSLLAPLLFVLALCRQAVATFTTGNNRARRLVPPEDPILLRSANCLARQIRSKKLTSEEVVSAFADRCRLANGLVNAIIDQRFEEALRDARRVDTALRADTDNISALCATKPLLGLAVTVKENCRVKGMKFTDCVRRFEKRRAKRDGAAVRSLVEAGAIPVAVTSTSPYCLYPHTENQLIGATLNPYDPSRSIGGSSGGEAALLTSAASVIGLATDAGGSIVIPCSFASLYGHRSACESLVMADLASVHDEDEDEMATVVGPMCRYVQDIELMLDVLCGSSSNLSDQIARVDVSALTVYYIEQLGCRGSLAADDAVKEKVRAAAQYLGHVHGCRVQPNADLGRFRDRMLVKLMSVLSVIFELNADEATRQEARKVRSTAKKNMRELLSDKAVLLLPAYPHAAFRADCWAFLFEGGATFYAAFAAFFDVSSTVVPAAFDRSRRLPVAIQVVANAREDRLCIAVAKKLDRLFGGWQPPPYTTTASAIA
ncbi:hypothetical protein V9T40_001388 [Parthenolecanium corni]|uniref:Amidase domain-containing protein n=1 Tax=Parthenolecanium corni TaxID=536013 RepID=A0AAN9TCU1_9HEMI